MVTAVVEKAPINRHFRNSQTEKSKKAEQLESAGITHSLGNETPHLTAVPGGWSTIVMVDGAGLQRPCRCLNRRCRELSNLSVRRPILADVDVSAGS